MILIIAEKPSLARNIVAGIDGKLIKKAGYFEGAGYLVTWTFGHLFSLCDIEEYTGKPTGKWTMEELPCLPAEFRFRLRGADGGRTPDEGVKRQFETIRSLCLRGDVDTIVNAGDADREGEIIVRLCIDHALKNRPDGGGKRLMRLWLPDQTPETVAAALSSMKPETAYDNLANEGFARTYTDWLYGVNLTRYATLKTGAFLRVGRVIIPIVKAIYDRDMAIRNFVPEIYYTIASRAVTNGETVELISKKRFSKEETAKAEAACRAYNEAGCTVTDKKTKKETVRPGKLYSLSKLQNVLGKKYKMPMDKSLAVAQKLYEEGYLTYPRTNSEYLATAEADKIKKVLERVKALGYPVVFKSGKTIFDDAKIEAHSALTPTHKIPDKNKLTEEEQLVYSTVFRRFAAVFCAEDCIAEKTEIEVACGDYETFSLKGTVILQRGWMKYDDAAQKDKILPNLSVGDTVNVDFKPAEKETAPPKHYTIETLNNYLKNPFREEKAAAKENAENDGEGSDDEDYRAIFEGLELGTEATRTGIIENARKSNYILLKKDVYTILPEGEYLIEALMRMKISMDKYKTSELGRALKKVYRGEMSISDSVALAKSEIAAVFHREEEPLETDTDDGFFRDSVGKCPLCGGTVRRTRFGYGCERYKEGCRFTVSGVICRRVISKKNVELLLSTGKTAKIGGFISKNGKAFDAVLKLEGGNVKFDFS